MPWDCVNYDHVDNCPWLPLGWDWFWKMSLFEFLCIHIRAVGAATAKQPWPFKFSLMNCGCG